MTASSPSDPGRWPEVSVVIPTHGRPELLRQTVQSILDQDYPGRIETLVVFDREDPHRPDVQVPPNREVRILRNTRTPGPAGCYNEGALAATGTMFALCDDDDEWLPEKARLQVQEWRERGRGDFIVCGVYLGDDAVASRNPTRIPAKDTLVVDDLLNTARNALHSSTFMVVRERILTDIGLVDEQIPGSYGEDFDWLIRAALVTPVLVVRRPLVRVRWKFSYFSDRWQTMIDAITYQLEHRSEWYRQPANLSRVYGRMAFAHAALGNGRQARELARKSIRLNWKQPRGYLTYLVAYRVLSPKVVLRGLHAVGRGM